MTKYGHSNNLKSLSRFVTIAIIAMTTFMAADANARVRLENICRVHGEEDIHLVGIGLVTGLDGTGDGGDAAPTIRALAAAMKAMNAPVLDPRELKNADNVAIVNIEATIPRGGLQKGQKLDCYVSSSLGARSLRGGRLLLSALQTADVSDDRLIAIASGEVIVENPATKTTGRILRGVQLKVDMVSEQSYLNRIISLKKGQQKISLLLDEAHSSVLTSSEIARVLNDEFSFLMEGKDLAKAISPSVIDVLIPEAYLSSQVEFVANVLQVWVDSPHTQAKVIVNTRTNTVIVTAEVEISPALVTHPGLEITVGAPNLNPVSRFADLRDENTTQTTARLSQLIQAMKALQVPPEGIIEVLRELSKSGKLHAIYEER